MIRPAKWCLFALALTWTGYAAWRYFTTGMILADAPGGESTLLLHALVYGPLIVTSRLLMTRWPERAAG